MKRSTPLLLTALLLLSLVLSACSAGSTAPQAPSVAAAPEYKSESSMADGMMGMGEVAEAAPQASAGMTDALREAKLIRRAQLDIQTLDFDGAVAALDALTRRLGGYYESASVSGGDYYAKNAARWASYAVRVPKEQYDAFLGGAGEIGHVVASGESQEDVGEVYYDTELRLKTQQVKLERLLALMEKADKMEDIISLENAATEVQYQIEQYTSSLKRYDSLVDYATISIEMREVLAIEETPVQSADFGSRLANAFTAGFAGAGHAMQGLALWLAYNLIGVLIFAAVAVAVVLILRKRLRRPPVTEQSSDDQK